MQNRKSINCPQFLFIIFLFLSLTKSALGQGNLTSGIRNEKKAIVDAYGAIVRGDVLTKEIALVFTGDQFADGGSVIQSVLNRNKVKASFFLTGNFYATPEFKSIISQLKRDGHYMGAHSDKHLLYADWTKRDSLLVTRKEFTQDLKKNYKRMAQFEIKKTDAPYFLPPYEWYNESIARWTKELQLQLINFSPGTRSAADYTYPEMKNYRSSDEIFDSIMNYEAQDRNGLNGFILLMHIGTDPRRTDKLYNRLDTLLNVLQRNGYYFVRIDQMLK